MDIYIPRILMEVSQLWPVIVLFMAMGMILLADITLEARVADTLRSVIVAFCLLAVVLTCFNFMNDPNIDFMNSGLLAGALIFDRVFLFQSMFLSLVLLGIVVVSEPLSPINSRRSIFLCLMLASLAGTILIGSTRHLIFLALAVELSSLPIYALIARPNDQSVHGREANLRYIFTGMICSAIMVLGISLLYGMTGSFEFQKIALRISIGGIEATEIFALACLGAGIGFKLMLVPLARPNINVITSSRFDSGVWLTVAGSAAGLIAFARLLQILTWFASDSFNAAMVRVLLIVFGLSILAATIGAFRSSSVKRLLAWASIVHIASMAMGLLVWSGRSGLASVLMYLIIFALTTLGVFTIAGLVERSRGTDRLEKFTGLSYKNPLLAAAMMLLLLSLIGVPPLAGFSAKWNLLVTLWENGFQWSAAGVLLASVLSVFYYLRIVRAMYSKSADTCVVEVPRSVGIILFICTAGVFVLFLGRNLLINLCYNLTVGFWG